MQEILREPVKQFHVWKSPTLNEVAHGLPLIEQPGSDDLFTLNKSTFRLGTCLVELLVNQLCGCEIRVPHSKDLEK